MCVCVCVCVCVCAVQFTFQFIIYSFVNSGSDIAMWSTLIICLLLTYIVVELYGADCKTFVEKCSDPKCVQPRDWCPHVPFQCPNCVGGG